MDLLLKGSREKHLVLYMMSRCLFALSLLHAAAFLCYQEKVTAYKAECVFGLTLISKRDYEAEAHEQIEIYNAQ